MQSSEKLQLEWTHARYRLWARLTYVCVCCADQPMSGHLMLRGPLKGGSVCTSEESSLALWSSGLRRQARAGRSCEVRLGRGGGSGRMVCGEILWPQAGPRARCRRHAFTQSSSASSGESVGPWDRHGIAGPGHPFERLCPSLLVA